MKNLKALIKIERTPALLMSIYFLLINLIAIVDMVGHIKSNAKHYLAYGIKGFSQWSMNSFIFSITMMLLIGYGVGLLVLVYLQFKKDKSIEISRFIKALPYTNGQRACVKIGLGILSFTLPFVIYVGMFLMVRSYALNLYDEIYRVTSFEEVVAYLNRAGVYLSFMGVTYIRMIVIYLIFVMCEYLMSHNIGSLIVAILSALAPAYIWVSSTYNLFYIEKRLKINEWLYKIYIDYTEWGQIRILGTNDQEYVGYSITEAAGQVSLVYMGLIIICSLVIMLQVKKQRIENADILMPGKVTRYIFIVGVAVCGGCLIRDIGRIVLSQIVFGYPVAILYGLLAVGFVSGGLIAMKIAHIGLQCKKEV